MTDTCPIPETGLKRKSLHQCVWCAINAPLSCRALILMAGFFILAVSMAWKWAELNVMEPSRRLRYKMSYDEVQDIMGHPNTISTCERSIEYPPETWQETTWHYSRPRPHGPKTCELVFKNGRLDGYHRDKGDGEHPVNRGRMKVLRPYD